MTQHRTKRTTGVDELITVTAETGLKERYTRMFQTQNTISEMRDVTDMSSTDLMLTRTLHASQVFTQNTNHTTDVSTSDEPLISSSSLADSTVDAEPWLSSSVRAVSHTEDHSVITDAHLTFTESSTSALTLSNTDGTNASARISTSTKTDKDTHTVLPFKHTRTTRAITAQSTPNTDTPSAKTRASETTKPTAVYTSTPAPNTFTSAIYTTKTTTVETITTTVTNSPAPLKTTTPPLTTASTTQVRNDFY